MADNNDVEYLEDTPRNKVSRQWCFTVYNLQEMPQEMARHMTYCISQLERCPSSGRLHFQCYAQFSQGVKMTHIHKWLGVRCHCEPQSAFNSEAAANYCKKEETRVNPYVEMGSFSSTKKGRGEKMDSAKVRTKTAQVLNHAELIEINRMMQTPGELNIWQALETAPWRDGFAPMETRFVFEDQENEDIHADLDKMLTDTFVRLGMNDR